MAPRKKTAAKKRKNFVRRKALTWTKDPEGVKRAVLEAARAEFALRGFSGARVDQIIARTATSKRMIYYYFQSKMQLYIAVLEDSFARMRNAESSLDLESLQPEEAIAKLTGFAFDYHADNPVHVRLVMVENIHEARNLQKSSILTALNFPILEIIGRIYRRGVAAGTFREDLDPITIHMTITSMSMFNVTNRATFNQVFGHDMAAPENRKKRRAQVIDAVLSYLRPR